MERFLEVKQVIIRPPREYARGGGRPWMVQWVTDNRLFVQTFQTSNEALEAVASHWVTSPNHPAFTSNSKARLPLMVPSVKAIEAWIYVADELLKAALARRAA
jgi:hypothetical protein